ncbi:MAG: sigma-70 family RNA polymerase sigma factor [Nannocystaceae bacterium]|nr:sigma-70 family RNA polymerase sigma factor [bacterium]
MSAALALTDPRGFRDVYQTHHGFVWHALHRFGLGGAALEDAVQDVFVVAYRRREDFAGSPKAWLYAIARRVASNHRRSAKRRTARADALAHALSEPRKPVPEAIVELDRYLERLSDADRELFYLSEVEGMTGPEIAAALGRNLNTVYTRIRKLRTSLRDGAVTERARAEQPRASARGWAALSVCLEPAAKALGWGAAALGVGLVAAAVTVGAVAMPRSSGDTEPTTSQTEVAAEVAPEATPRHEPVAAAASTPPSPQIVAPEPVAQAPAPKPSVPGAPAVVEAEPSTLAHENALLQQARSALAEGQAERALEIVVAHARTYPDSALADLRAVVRVEALCALGKQPQARAEATILLERRPAMTARRRIEKSCAGSPQNPGKPDMTGT